MPLRAASARLRLAILLCLAAWAAACEGIPLGRWVGTANLGSGEEPMALRVLEAGGLVDLPARGLYGLPLGAYRRDAEGLLFSLPGEAGDLVFDASRIASDSGGPPSIGGSCAGPGGFESPFRLEYRPRPDSGEAYPIDTGRGLLPGTLLEPPGDGNGSAVALIVAGSGPIDRDGNNYSVPGRCDSLKALALALAERGVASLRYDKRGAGEAYVLVRREEDLVFDDYVDDAVEALRLLSSDGRFARVVVVGHGEGALVAAAAMAGFKAAGLGPGGKGSRRLALLCASARTPLEEVAEALAGLPPERRDEASRIVSRLAAGLPYPDPSPFFADFFRPSAQPYLISSFRYSLLDELGKDRSPLLVVQGGADPSATAADAVRVAEARPDARTLVLASMGRALKEVGEGPDEAYRAYTDPDMPLSGALADALASFALEGLVLLREDPRGD